MAASHTRNVVSWVGNRKTVLLRQSCGKVDHKERLVLWCVFVFACFVFLSFCHVNGSCRVTLANRGEKSAKIRRRYLLPVTSAERNDSESEWSNVINTEKWPLAEQVMKKNQTCHQNVSFVGHLVCCT